MADEKKQPLVQVLVREIGVDELALVAALRKQTRVPLIDPKTCRSIPMRCGSSRKTSVRA
jgi:hypothetical protein